MNYRQYDNFEYQNAVAQDLGNWAIKILADTFITLAPEKVKSFF